MSNSLCRGSSNIELLDISSLAIFLRAAKFMFRPLVNLDLYEEFNI